MNRYISTLLIATCSLFSIHFSLAQCSIFDLNAVHGDCEAGVFYVTIDFEYENVGDEGFHVQGGGANYGNFEYSALPIVIGPLPGNGSTYEFVAIDNQFNDCQDFDIVGPISCPAGNCDIWDLTLEPSDCDGDGNYDLTISFQYEQPGNDFFDVFYDGQNIGFFSLDDLPVTIENFEDNGEFSPALGVCINDNPNCCAEAEFVAPDCPGSGDCDIIEFVVETGDCNPDGTYNLWLDFGVQNPTNGFFDVIYEGDFIGFYSIADLPIMIENFEDNGEPNQVIHVCINDNPNCCGTTEFEAPDCPGTGDCNIFDLHVVGIDCVDDQFYITFDFEFQNVGNAGFTVQGNGVNYGNFSYDDVPFTLGPLPANGTNYEFIVKDVNHPDCSDFVNVGVVNCGDDCEIWDVFAEAHVCNDDGQFLVDIAFHSNNTGSEGFTIIANGEEYGPFEYGENFYTFGPLESGSIYEILIQDNENPDCHGFYQFGPIYCGDDCHIFDLHAEVTDCDDDGQFFVILDFEYSSTGNEGFKVVGNGNTYGFFEYGDLPITLGPFQTPIDDLEFIASDVQHPDCHDFVEVNAPNCDGNGDCQISGLTADVTDCDDDGQFFVVLDFDFENTSNIGFSVHGNGINYGLFSYSVVPVSIGPLVGNGTTPYEFVVSDLLHPDCHDAVAVGPVDCDPSGDCNIINLVADAGSCHDDGTYNLFINFEVDNPTNNFFDVIYEGVVVDFFPLVNLPLVLPHFQDNGNTEQEITICINDNPNCCATVSYEAPDCNGPNLVWPGDTDSDNASNHFDLLNIGLAFGNEGPERAIQGFEWTELLAEPWQNSFSTGLNFAHADCDGNGNVNEADMQALQTNFGQTHGDLTPPVLLGGTENDPPFFVDLPNGTVTDGTQFSALIQLGSEASPVSDLYGVAFTLKFDPAIIDPGSIELVYDPSWLGVEGINLVTFEKVLPDAGEVKVALVRTDQNDVSGHGQVAGFIGIIDNIAGKESMIIEIKDVKAIQGNEVLIPLARPVYEVSLTTGTNELVQGVFEVYPNPARSEVFLQHPDNLQAISVEVRNTDGRILQTGEVQRNLLNVSDLPSGVYFLKIETTAGFFLEKLVKI